jgi:hypothetical protein
MLKYIIVIPALFLFVNISAQSPAQYDWDTTRERYVLSVVEEQLPEIILKEHEEYLYTFEKDQFVLYNIYHRIARLNNDEAIQRHNRITIPMNRTFELVEIKARTINLNGNVINFDKKNLKEVQQNNGEGGSRLFAMEGVIIGSEVEYYYIRKMTPSLQESNYLQMDVPIKSLSFVVKCPKHLEFDFKSYNGLADIKTEETEKENIYSLVMNNIPASREEEFAFANAKKMRLEYKLAYNTAKSKARINTWDDAGKRFYSLIYSIEKDAQKTVERYVKELNDNPSDPLTKRIRRIERKIKTSVRIDTKGSGDALDNVESIIEYKVASPQGMVRLMANVFEVLNIRAQVVLTCSREYAAFDGDFDTFNYLDDYILFFPETSQFLSPYNLSLSYPIIDSEFTAQHGLFIEPVSIGSLNSAIASVREIAAVPYSFNTDNLFINVKFSDDLEENRVDLKREFSGYNSSYIASNYHLMTDEQKLLMVDELLKQTAPGLTINDWKGVVDVEGDVDQFILNVNFTSSHFIERAGQRLLFKVGLLIGPQSELYNEDERVNPVENDYNRGYDRVIKVQVPAGYRVKNPEDLDKSVLYKDGDSVPYSFVSAVESEGQMLTITIKEYYKEIYAPLDRYEDYRKVINAAADFNKVTLVLEKK